MLKSIDLKYTIIYVYIQVYVCVCVCIYIYINKVTLTLTLKGKGTRLSKTVLKVKKWEESVYPILRLTI